MQYTRNPMFGFVAVAVILCVLPAAWPLDDQWLAIVLCGLILVFGLPHGAYDIFLLRAQAGGKRMLQATLLYVLAALSVALVWWLSPALFLVAFLALSIIHFGDSDWPDASWLSKLCWGILVLAVPVVVQPGEVGALFAALAPSPVASWSVQGLSLLLIPAALGLLLQREALGIRFAVLLLLALVCLRTSSLVGFALYFCLFHSRIHLARWRQRLPVQDTRLASFLAALVIAVVGLGTFIYAADIPSISLDSSAITVTFLALASLTAPHMITVALANRNH